MKGKLLLAALVILVIVSCRKSVSNMISEGSNTPSASASKSHAVPFKGNMTYVLNPTLNLSCNCGSMINVGDFDGAGITTHMGNLTSRNKTCATPIVIGTTHIGNHIVIQCGSFTTANGDQIFVNINPYDLMFGNTCATGQLTAEFAGGTGRFVNATGSFTGLITLNYSNPNVVTLTNINGSINY
jgi:hypothetical protein